MKKLNLTLILVVALTFVAGMTYADNHKKSCGGEANCSSNVAAKCAQSRGAGEACKSKDAKSCDQGEAYKSKDGKSCGEAAACNSKDGTKCGDACKDDAADACANGCQHAAAEQRKHQQRRSKIEQMKALAAEVGDEKLISRLDQISRKEKSRHEKSLNACREDGCQAVKAKSCSDKGGACGQSCQAAKAESCGDKAGAKACGSGLCDDRQAKKCCGSESCKK
jgi:hypothetical protein